MDYELCEKLYQSGFPVGDTGRWIDSKGIVRDFQNGVDDTETYYPTLSELIEACGDKFEKLELFKDKKFYAVGIRSSLDSFHRHGIGSIPEEATAKLWLELNKK